MRKDNYYYGINENFQIEFEANEEDIHTKKEGKACLFILKIRNYVGFADYVFTDIQIIDYTLDPTAILLKRQYRLFSKITHDWKTKMSYQYLRYHLEDTSSGVEIELNSSLKLGSKYDSVGNQVLDELRKINSYGLTDGVMKTINDFESKYF